MCFLGNRETGQEENENGRRNASLRITQWAVPTRQQDRRGHGRVSIKISSTCLSHERALTCTHSGSGTGTNQACVGRLMLVGRSHCHQVKGWDLPGSGGSGRHHPVPAHPEQPTSWTSSLTLHSHPKPSVSSPNPVTPSCPRAFTRALRSLECPHPLTQAPPGARGSDVISPAERPLCGFHLAWSSPQH